MKLQPNTAPPKTGAADNVSTANQEVSDAAALEPASRQISTSNEVPPRVINTKYASQVPALSTHMSGLTTTEQQNYGSSSASSQGANAASAVQELRLATDFGTITTEQLEPGDLVFKVGSERSNNVYQKQMKAQSANIKNNNYTTNHQDSLPVELHKVNHCDVAMGDGTLAKVGGARNKYEWGKLGAASPTHYLPMRVIERDTDNDYVVMRPNNSEVAKNMAATAKRHIDREDSHFSVPKLLKAWIFPADKGEKQIPSLTGHVEGPQPKPIEIPKATFCTEYISQVVISGERETLRQDRRALDSESVSFPKLSPPELMDTLMGSGNFTYYNLDREQNHEERDLEAGGTPPLLNNP